MEIQQQPQTIYNKENLTSLMQQYWDMKAQVPDCLLLFRLGDFYELFDADAQVGARELEITLTGRTEPGYPGGRVPMCGIPVKSYETYVSRLLSKGYSVAVCEQTGIVGVTKGPVDRKITRILTPGTVLESNYLPARQNNYLVALLKGGTVETELGTSTLWGLASVDASCGEFFVSQMSEDKLLIQLTSLSPSEILVAKKTERKSGIPQESLEAPPLVLERYRITGRPSMFFQLEPSKRRILQHFSIMSLEGFGCHDMPLAIGAAGAILEYLEKTQGSLMPKFTGINTYSADNYLVIDESTRRNLELTETSRERSFYGSLLWCIDKTQTAMGSRLIRNWLLKPLLSLSEITARQDAIAELLSNQNKLKEIQSILSGLADLERLAIKLLSANISPKDFTAIAYSLKQLPLLASLLEGCQSSYLKVLQTPDPQLEDLRFKIENALASDPPREITNGGIFCNGYSSELDEFRSLLGGGKEWIEKFQQHEAQRTQIKSLKVSFNSTFGYYIEITHANKELVPQDYIRKQTLTNAERYITPELKEYEAKILSAEKNQSELEYKLFIAFRNDLLHYGQQLRSIANSLAALDALQSLAIVAGQQKYVRPELDKTLALEIQAGRHPVLENMLPMGVFVSNDLRLYGNSKEQQMIILTGPNMSGKSSYLRQTALIIILAQMGSYVPASVAHIGLVDRIFTRIGAVDDLTQGQSTFLVEMNETTQCCVCATPRSLILLDEVGRGTSTYDGVAIAWSVAEYLASVVKARTIFATHYHELNGLANLTSEIKNYQVQVAESQGKVEFLHRVIPGGASHSFGIHVASMSGLPKQIIERAHYLMAQMEKRSAASKILDGPKMRNTVIDETMQLTLFTSGAVDKV